MSDLLTIDPFKHGSFTHVAHFGLTNEKIRIKLAQRDVTGDFVTVPKYTAFFAYRRVLGIAQAHADGWEAERFDLLVGDSNIKVQVNTRDCGTRHVKWVRGRHEGAEYSIVNSGSASPQIGTVTSYGKLGEPKDAEEYTQRKRWLLNDASAAYSLPTQVLSHRIYRKIPPGYLTRFCINNIVEYWDEPDVDKAIQVSNLMTLTGIRDPEAWISRRLRPIEQLAA